MKFNFLKAIVISITLLLTSVAQAGLIRTTMDLTITNVFGFYSTVAVGDVFKFSAVYDDEGTFMKNTETSYNCTTDHLPVVGVACTSVVDVEFFSQAMFNFSDMYDIASMLADGGIFFDRTEYDVTAAYRSGGSTVIGYVTDQFNLGHYPIDNISSAVLNMYYLNNLGERKLSGIIFSTSNVQSERLDVPEPSTMAILVLGIIGLMSRQFNKQS